MQANFCKTVSYTTREMREAEVDGVDYYFVTKEEFERLIAQNFFVEYKVLNENYYGTPIGSYGDNSISICGNFEKIRGVYSGKIELLYIDAPLDVRYKRVKRRKISNQELFERFHLENYRYLYNFSAYFIDNSRDSDKSFEDILLSLREQSQFKNNIDFLSNIVEQGFNISSDDELLTFLQYDEFILRRLFLDENVTGQNIYLKYLEEMKSFARKRNIKLEQITDEEILVRLNNEDYRTKFVKEKILVRERNKN